MDLFAWELRPRAEVKVIKAVDCADENDEKAKGSSELNPLIHFVYFYFSYRRL